MIHGTYSLIALIGVSLALWPEETINVFTAVGLKIQIYYINYRMKWIAWRLHRQLTRVCKEAGFPDPGPFRFTNLWDRES